VKYKEAVYKRPEVVAAVKIYIVISWDMMPRGLVYELSSGLA
jgi:hypothetical protein